MFLPVPPRREPVARRTGGCAGAVIGAFLTLSAVFVSLKGGGASPGGDDIEWIEIASLVCSLGFWIGVGGLFGYLIGRRFGRQTVDSNGD